MAKVSFDVYHNVVNGQLKGAEKHYHGINPFTEDPLWPAPVATKADLDDAVSAASAAFQTWRNTSVEERRRRLHEFADALLAQKEEWIDLISKETGQSKEYAEGEIEGGAEFLTAIGNLDLPEYVTQEDDEVKVVTRYFPLGVVAAICPWNFPVVLAAGKLAAAVVTGNTVILKPSPFTPYTELKLAEVAQSFFPPGVVQALGGDDNLGPWMTTHPGIAKISFTGSTATGKKIMAAAAATLKRVTLELGGNDPAIVCPDVDLDAIIPQIVDDAFSHAGQVCVAAKRIYVHSSIYAAFLAKFTAACKDLKPGHGFLSALQNRMQYDKVRDILADCRAQNLEFALGGPDVTPNSDSKQAGASPAAGFLLPPTIISRPPDTARIVHDEQFGPVVPVLAWDDEDEVLARANAGEQGLGATLWCRDPERAQRMAARLEAGSVWVNRGAVTMPTAYFGGVKQSGVGGEWGQLGLVSYCEARTFHFGKRV